MKKTAFALTMIAAFATVAMAGRSCPGGPQDQSDDQNSRHADAWRRSG